MRKAASQLTRVFLSSAILVLLFVFFSSVVRAYSLDPSKPISGDQNTGDAITGNIQIVGTTAVATVVNSGSDNVKIGLASYLKVDEDLENQTLHDSEVVNLGAGETKELRVTVPCWSQVDLFRVFPERPGQEGGVITSFKGNVRYGQRVISAIHTQNDCQTAQKVEPIVECVAYGQSLWTVYWGYNNRNSVPVTVPYGAENQFDVYGPNRGQPVTFEVGRHTKAFSNIIGENTAISWILQGKKVTADNKSTVCPNDDPSPSDTPFVTPSPVPSSTSTSSNPPQGGDGSTNSSSDGRSDNLGCSVRDCSGNAVGGSSVVAGVSTDRSLPVTGYADIAPSIVLGVMILGMGLGLRRMAYNLE